MRFSSEQRLDDGVLEREFFLGDIPGFLWTPALRPAPAPLILLGHPGGLPKMYPMLQARARHSLPRRASLRRLSSCPAAVTGRVPLSLRGPGRSAPGAGGRRPVDDDIVDRLILPLVEAAVPEWRAALDALLALPEIGGPVGYGGGVLALSVRLALVEPRIAAALLFAGSYVPRAMFEEARRVTIPLLVLLQWDDEGNDRQMALDLFDALGSQGEDAARQPGRAHRRPARSRGTTQPVLRPAPDMSERPHPQSASSCPVTVSAVTPLMLMDRTAGGSAASETWSMTASTAGVEEAATAGPRVLVVVGTADGGGSAAGRRRAALAAAG